MAVTMTWIGLDVHARSVEASVVDSLTGELRRRRVSGSEVGPIVEWLGMLPGPVRACYEAGPTGYGLARAARQAGISMEVIAPSKTPRPPGDRRKTDRRDAELLVRYQAARRSCAERMPRKTSTSSGSNCEPAPFSSSWRASSAIERLAVGAVRRASRRRRRRSRARARRAGSASRPGRRGSRARPSARGGGAGARPGAPCRRARRARRSRPDGA